MRDLRRSTDAVSPVVGVMLMLVVVIIIAAVVSAFAGGTVSGQKKVPQATIQGKFSIANGMEIIHAGGEGLATAETVFVIRDGAMFGPNLEQKTAQILNRSLIVNSNGQSLDSGSGTQGFTSFVSGETLYIYGANSTCSLLQPSVDAGGESTRNLCVSNVANIGKTFSLEVSDRKGNLISKTDVTITT
jgi:archaeal type IV pilus assembly protein PilA